MILVTGATGKVGSEAVRLLGAQNYPTRALVTITGTAPRDLHTFVLDHVPAFA